MSNRPESFAVLRERTAASNLLTPNRRRTVPSNLTAFCKVVGVPAEHLACDVEVIRTLMAKATPAAFGISLGYWSKICSSVWFALELQGIKVIRGTGLELTIELAMLLRDVPRHPERTELTPILKFLMAHDISASELRQEHIPTLREWLKKYYARRNWSRAMKKTLRRWKKCQEEYGAHWPQAPLEPEYEDRDWALPWSHMAMLEAVVNAHINDLQKPKSRRHGGQRRVLKASTLEARKGYLRRLASAIAFATGFVPENLEDLTDPESVEHGVDYIMDMRSAETSGDVYQMLRHVNAIARHNVRLPDEQLAELKKIRKSVAPPPGAAEKNLALIQKFRGQELRELFLTAPAKVLNKLKRKKALTRNDLIEGMLAFLAALLTKVPMRISEAMALEFGKTLHDHGSGRDRQVIIDLPEEVVKNGVPRRTKLGLRLVALLDIYIELIRKPLVGTANWFLFPSTGDAARSPDHMSQSLAAWTTKHVIRMTAQQWRHVVGYIYLLEHPGCYETVRRFLGHRSVTTTIEYYAFVLEDDANASLDDTIDDLTDRHPHGRRPPKRRR